MLRDDELPPLPEPHKPAVYATAENTFSVRNRFELGGYEKEPPLYSEDQMCEYGRAVEQAAYERAAAHVRTLKRDQWYLRVAPEIVVEECAVAIEKLMMQEQPR